LTTINLKTATGNCRIITGGTLGDLGRLIPEGRAAIVTDTTVKRFHGPSFPGLPAAAIRPGEASKTLRTVERLHRSFLEWEMDRSSFVIGIGGGIVCDIAGFAASTYMRGIRFGFVPSTLLAQADAAIGGKNGVNVGRVKNIAGVFRQPDFVLYDYSLLGTLPQRERLCGFSEIVKHALIADGKLFDYLEREAGALLALDPGVLKHVMAGSIRIKSAIVEADVREMGERRKLNFGHTLGHAIEKESGLPHGEAVAVGMAAATRISAEKGMISRSDADRVVALLEKSGLPVRSPLSPSRLIEAMKRDKKRRGDSVHLVLLSAIGRAEVVEVRCDELKGIFDDLRQYR
jgi:3-dehydroquinate synthase